MPVSSKKSTKTTTPKTSAKNSKVKKNVEPKQKAGSNTKAKAPKVIMQKLK